MLLLKELHHDNIVSLLGAGFLPDGRRFVALVSVSQPFSQGSDKLIMGEVQHLSPFTFHLPPSTSHTWPLFFFFFVLAVFGPLLEKYGNTSWRKRHRA